MLIDSHAHLDHSREDPGELVADAREVGVGLIIQCGTDLPRSRQSVELAEQFPEVFATVGYHPHEAAKLDDAGLDEISKWTAHERVVAVGETGFDYYHDHCPHAVQGEVFIHHLRVAREADLPVVVHTRDAAEDTLATLSEYAEGLTVVLHCFSLPNLLDEVVERGYYVSFAGNVTYKNARELQVAAQVLPDDLLLLETDTPWLAPMPMRGRPNRPGLVAETYEFVAGLRGVTVEELAAQIEANVGRVFPRLTCFLERRA
jgi:TatD DNase family protein